ncbi:FAD-dependent oxidoreductase [Chloroflexota bacterium]
MLEKLFSPVEIGTMRVRNRIVFPPIHTGYAAPDGKVTDTLIAYHQAQARGGVGLIVTGVVSVVEAAQWVPNQIVLYDDNFIPGLKQLAEAVHARGAKLAPQLVHPGPENLYVLSKVRSVGPSPILDHYSKEVSRELSVEEIEGIIEDFGQAARRAREAGCDGVEIHAAHSHLLVGVFLSPYRNKRFDAYGGSIEGRVKFSIEVIKRIKEIAGHDFPVILRISGDEIIPGGRTIQETQYIAPLLVEAGVDAFEISGGVWPELAWRTVPPMGTPLGLNVPYAAAIKEAVEVPIIAVGRINNPRMAEHILGTGKADLVSMGRALLADPDLPNKASEGRYEDIVPCIGCLTGCQGARAQGKPMTCLVNPTLGREGEITIAPAQKSKKVLVVGGGPAGLEAARMAAVRGHSVTLFEKAAKLGGQINLASVPPLKQEICLVLKYLATQVEKAGVKVELGKEVTPELVGELKPDVVVVASGAAPFIPDMPGVEGERVCTAWDVLAGNAAQRARNIVVLGGGMVGCEVADCLASRGDNLIVGRRVVTIVTRQRDVALDMLMEPRQLLMERLREKEVRMLTRATTKEILDNGVLVVKDGGEESIVSADCVVLARGVKPVDELSEAIKDKVAEVYVIGDAKEPRQALEAISEGMEVGRNI